MTSESDKARAILNAAAIFNTGCGNTALYQNLPPESCEECAERFVSMIARILSGEVTSIPYTGPKLRPDAELH